MKVLSPLIIKADSTLPIARHELEAEEKHLNNVDGVIETLPATPTPSIDQTTASATPPATPSAYSNCHNGDGVVNGASTVWNS